MTVSYQRTNGIAVIRIDDSKVNAMSSALIAQIHHALDQAESDKAITVISGNERLFSAGFDLKELRASKEAARKLVSRGAELCLRLMAFPCPVIAACSGHAYPMGAFLLMSSDYRVGVDGPFSLGMNEVRIDMTVPKFATELARGRLLPAYFNRTVITGELLSPSDAVTAGILDELVDAGDLHARAMEKAEEFKAVDFAHHHASKLRARGGWIEAVQKGIEQDLRG